MSNEKPNCYKCTYRRGVSGSAHSSCHHPKIKRITDDPLGQLMAIFASVGRVTPSKATLIAGQEQLGIEGDLHGIYMDWFWPHNFDPTWLRRCNGFKGSLKTNID